MSELQTTNVLDDVRRALGRTQSIRPSPLTAFVESAAPAGHENLRDQFTAELLALGANIHRLPQTSRVTELADVIVDICRSPGSNGASLALSQFTSADELKRELVSRGLSVFVPESSCSHDELVRELAAAKAGITAIEYAIAETGTIVLSSDEAHSLLVSLLPPIYIALMKSSQISGTLDQIINKLAVERMTGPVPSRSVSFITGPSRTSDVELTLSIGVHGPKQLHIIIMESAPGAVATGS